jgi:glycerol-3-phosphate dehydrogenase
MTRDVSALTARTFDVLVVGGGIYGLTIACDAAQRGLSVALVERHDFGSGSSFNHLRTIHGGLRYLQTLDIGRARESIRERRTLAVVAPAAVRPLPFVLPLTRSLTAGKLAMRAGFALDSLVGRDRNAALPSSHRLPSGRVMSRRQTLNHFPSLEPFDFSSTAVWFDYVTTEPDRLTWSWGMAARAHGAVLANYVDATELIRDGQRIVGVRARDQVSETTMDIGARLTVNATGGAIDQLLRPVAAPTRIPMLKAMNIVTRRPAVGAALGRRARSGRHLFMVPWRGRSLFGTWESAGLRPAGDTGVNGPDVDDFLHDLGHAFANLELTRDDVTLVHRGIVPAIVRPGGGVALDGREHIRDHTSGGVAGILSVAGTKYTTARAVAERVTDRLMVRLGRPAVPCRTSSTPLPWSSLTGDALLAAAVRDELVVTLADAVIRRTPMGAVGCPDGPALSRAASIAAAALGWDEARAANEIAAVRRFYEQASTR